MESINVILLIAIITTASCLIFIPGRTKGNIKFFLAFTIMMALLQLLIQGFYWHYLPGYLLIVFMVLIAIFSNDNSSKIKKRFQGFILICLLLATILPWSVFSPVPELIKPQGDYKVGTRIFRWIDNSRSEQITSDLNDKRNVVVQAWYPTEENTKGPHSDYLDGLDNLPEKIGILPGWIFDHYEKINTHGILNAPIAKTKNEWPVIIFLTGNVASRAFYTSLVAGLASHGYVVLAIDHPYEAMITQLANGKIVTTVEKHLNDDPDLTKFMIARLELRIADIMFVLNQIGNLNANTDSFFLSLDQNHIGITGHSLGGATAAAAMAYDSRIKAAANIDGTLYGELPKPTTIKPYLLIESKKEGVDRYLRYEKGNQQLFQQFGGGYRYEIPEADHYSFTDAPFLLAPPARFLVSSFSEFGHIPTKTQYATIDILHAFFNGTLNNKFTDLDSVADRYKGIIRKPVD